MKLHGVLYSIHRGFAPVHLVSDTDALSFLLPKDMGPNGKLECDIVFFDTIDNVMIALRAFQKQLPEHLRGRVKEYNALLGPSRKKHVTNHFNSGDIDILFSTEAAGMACHDLLVPNTSFMY